MEYTSKAQLVTQMKEKSVMLTENIFGRYNGFNYNTRSEKAKAK